MIQDVYTCALLVSTKTDLVIVIGVTHLVVSALALLNKIAYHVQAITIGMITLAMLTNVQVQPIFQFHL